MTKNLFEKVWQAHTVRTLNDGRTQLFIGLHLIHEVTSPQAFGMLRELNLPVKYPNHTFATVDHIIPTHDQSRPFKDSLAEEMIVALQKNTEDFGIEYFDMDSGKQGIVHVVGPEQGLTQPGMTICCGDSHTSTHGAFGSIAFGIGTSTVRDVLATQTLAMSPLKVRRVEITGSLNQGVYAKDVILHVIHELGVNGGAGYAYEFCGSVIDAMSMDERMTVCNMAIEGGARVGYCNPDEKTYAYLKGRRFSPAGDDWEKACSYWDSLASGPDAEFGDRVSFVGEEITPMVTWGINPGQAIGIEESIPVLLDNSTHQEALEHMALEEGTALAGTPVDVAFIGSCTNGRLSDIREVARLVEGHQVHERVKALVVPGSHLVAQEAEKEGLVDIIVGAGFEWRKPGCSMCLAMNPDKLEGNQLCVSSSNRNFKGRQGSTTGRTVLMSPASVAASAIAGKVADVRDVFSLRGEG